MKFATGRIGKAAMPMPCNSLNPPLRRQGDFNLPNPPAWRGRREVKSCCSSALQAVRSWCSKRPFSFAGGAGDAAVCSGWALCAGPEGLVHLVAMLSLAALRHRLHGNAASQNPFLVRRRLILWITQKITQLPAGNRSRKREGGRLSKPGALHHRLHAWQQKRSALRTRRLKRYPMPGRAGDVAPLCRRTSLHRRADDKPTKSTSRRNSSVLCGRRIPAEKQWRN